jgi:uncharacterized tellurite resistance protein B-like protein
MGMLDTIREFVASKRYDDLSQTQTEAFVDALTLAMIVDGDVAASETDEFEDVLDEFDWRGDVNAQSYADTALDRAETCVDDPAERREYCENIARRLDDDQLEEEVYYLAGTIATADRDILGAETELLHLLVETFDIDEQRLQSMTQELMNDL